MSAFVVIHLISKTDARHVFKNILQPLLHRKNIWHHIILLFMKKKILYSLLAIIIILGVWVAIYPQKALQTVVDFGMWMTSSMKHRDPSKEKPKFELTADAFSKEFKDNAAEATKKYINQAVLLEGNVTTVSGVTVSLNNIACNIDSTEVNKIKDIKVGAKMKIQGLVVGYNDIMDEVDLAQCTIK